MKSSAAFPRRRMSIREATASKAFSSSSLTTAPGSKMVWAARMERAMEEWTRVMESGVVGKAGAVAGLEVVGESFSGCGSG